MEEWSWSYGIKTEFVIDTFFKVEYDFTISKTCFKCLFCKKYLRANFKGNKFIGSGNLITHLKKCINADYLRRTLVSNIVHTMGVRKAPARVYDDDQLRNLIIEEYENRLDIREHLFERFTEKLIIEEQESLIFEAENKIEEVEKGSFVGLGSEIRLYVQDGYIFKPGRVIATMIPSLFPFEENNKAKFKFNEEKQRFEILGMNNELLIYDHSCVQMFQRYYKIINEMRLEYKNYEPAQFSDIGSLTGYFNNENLAKDILSLLQPSKFEKEDKVSIGFEDGVVEKEAYGLYIIKYQDGHIDTLLEDSNIRYKVIETDEEENNVSITRKNAVVSRSSLEIRRERVEKERRKKAFDNFVKYMSSRIMKHIEEREASFQEDLSRELKGKLELPYIQDPQFIREALSKLHEVFEGAYITHHGSPLHVLQVAAYNEDEDDEVVEMDLDIQSLLEDENEPQMSKET